MPDRGKLLQGLRRVLGNIRAAPILTPQREIQEIDSGHGQFDRCAGGFFQEGRQIGVRIRGFQACRASGSRRQGEASTRPGCGRSISASRAS